MTKSLQAVRNALHNVGGAYGKLESNMITRSTILAVKPGYVKMSYEIDELAECNRMGCVTAGVLTLLVDSATTTCLMTGQNRMAGVSVDLSLSYLTLINGNEHKEIIIESQVENEGRKISFLSCKVKNMDETITFATGYHTKFMHPKSRGAFVGIDFNETN